MVFDPAHLCCITSTSPNAQIYAAYHYNGLLGMVEFTFHHSLQFRDRSLDADSSGLPNTVEDVDVEDSALENSLASSYWFRACEETLERQTREISKVHKQIKLCNHKNLQNLNNIHSVPNSAAISFDGKPMSFRPPLLQFASLDSGRFVLAPRVSPQ